MTTERAYELATTVASNLLGCGMYYLVTRRLGAPRWAAIIGADLAIRSMYTQKMISDLRNDLDGSEVRITFSDEHDEDLPLGPTVFGARNQG